MKFHSKSSHFLLTVVILTNAFMFVYTSLFCRFMLQLLSSHSFCLFYTSVCLISFSKRKISTPTTKYMVNSIHALPYPHTHTIKLRHYCRFGCFNGFYSTHSFFIAFLLSNIWHFIAYNLSYLLLVFRVHFFRFFMYISIIFL